MNFKNKFTDALKRIKQKEEVYMTLCREGSKDPMDYHNMSYFSGLHNGFAFVWHVLDNDVTEKEFNKMLWEILQAEEVVKN